MNKDIPSRDEMIAMATALAALELNTDVSYIRVHSFKEVRQSCLAKYLEENNINYKKYRLGD